MSIPEEVVAAARRANGTLEAAYRPAGAPLPNRHELQRAEAELEDLVRLILRHYGRHVDCAGGPACTCGLSQLLA